MAGKYVRARLYRCNPQSFDIAPVLTSLDGMSYKDRTVVRAKNTNLYSIANPAQSGLGLWALREGAELYEDGKIKEWDLSSEIAEGSFYRFFDDVVVVIVTGYGPRPSALSQYLHDVCECSLIFDPILRVEKGTYVASLDDVARIEMTLTGESISVLRELDQKFGNTIASITGETGATKLGIVLGGKDSHDRDHMWSTSKSLVRRLVDRLPIVGVDKLTVIVPGEVGGQTPIDLIEDRITYQIGFEGVTLNYETAFDVARRAYDRYRADVA